MAEKLRHSRTAAPRDLTSSFSSMWSRRASSVRKKVGGLALESRWTIKSYEEEAHAHLQNGRNLKMADTCSPLGLWYEPPPLKSAHGVSSHWCWEGRASDLWPPITQKHMWNYYLKNFDAKNLCAKFTQFLCKIFVCKFLLQICVLLGRLTNFWC